MKWSRSCVGLAGFLSLWSNRVTAVHLVTFFLCFRKVILVPGNSENFWQEVAERLGTGHSAAACQEQYYTLNKKSTKEKGQESTQKREGSCFEQFQASNVHPFIVCLSDFCLADAANGPVTITGRVGTLKRKREFQQALSHLNKDYSDNVWDAPYLKRRLGRMDVKVVTSHPNGVAVMSMCACVTVLT